jgi:hypothetical protein
MLNASKSFIKRRLDKGATSINFIIQPMQAFIANLVFVLMIEIVDRI